MKENIEEYTVEDIIDGSKAFLSYLFKKWWILLLTVVAGVSLGLGYFYLQKPKYEAVTTFILQEKTPSLGGLASIASQFGFDIGGAGGSLFAGDNILQILTSKKIVQKVLLSELEEKGRTISLADSYLNFTKIKKSWASKPTLGNIEFKPGINNMALTPIQDSVLQFIYEKVIKSNLSIERSNKKASIFKVSVKSQGKQFSELMSERLVKEALGYYKTVKLSVSQKNVNSLERKADSILNLLNRRTYTAAAVREIDANPALRTIQVPTELASRDKTVLLTIYGEVIKNLEIAKITLMQETPIIEILDIPGKTLFDNKTRKILCCLAGVFITGCIVVVYLFIKFLKLYKRDNAVNS